MPNGAMGPAGYKQFLTVNRYCMYCYSLLYSTLHAIPLTNVNSLPEVVISSNLIEERKHFSEKLKFKKLILWIKKTCIVYVFSNNLF